MIGPRVEPVIYGVGVWKANDNHISVVVFAAQYMEPFATANEIRTPRSQGVWDLATILRPLFRILNCDMPDHIRGDFFVHFFSLIGPGCKNEYSRELGLEPERLEEKLVALPSWVQRQLADVAGLLQDEPERVRAHCRRIGLSFAVSAVLDAPRPFLRAVGTADLMKATFDREFDFPDAGRSLPRSGE